MAAVEYEAENEAKDEKDIRKLVLLESGKGEKGSIFESFFMNYEFDCLSTRGNHWKKDKHYHMYDKTFVELTHTVAKVFVANNLKHVGYVVLKDVIENSVGPQFLYYFSETSSAQHQRIALEQANDYSFYLEEKKYSLAADGTITEAKKEESESINELQKDVVVETEGKKKKFRSFNSPFSFLSSSELPDKSQQNSDKSKKRKGFFKPKSSLSLSSSASSPEIESVSSSPEIDRTDSVSPKIENVSPSPETSRASSTSPKIKSVRFA